MITPPPHALPCPSPSYLSQVSKEPVGWRAWELLESFEQPLAAQVVLGCLEQQQKQAQQEGHLQEPREAAREPGKV